MRNINIVLLCFFTTITFGQEEMFIGQQSNNTDKSVYTAMQNIWYANEPISYICPLPVINNQISPIIALREGEGKSKSYLFEANIHNQIPIAMGRNQSNHFYQTTRIMLDFGFNIRMAQDDSNPLIPNNNVVGLTFNKKIWNSYTYNGITKSNGLKYSFINWYDNPVESTKSFKDLSFDFTVHHYSNGQQSGFFLYDTINGKPVRRNDYKKGDFSTNYIKAGLTYSYLTKKRDLLSGNISYRWDGTIFKPLIYSIEQEKSFGHHRIMSFAQYRKLIKLEDSKPSKVYDVCAKDSINKILKRYGEIVCRWESEWIIDKDLSAYISTINKNRFNQHFYLQFTRPNWRALGLLFHAYYGRDYSNIRYDIPIVACMVGISVNFNKYQPLLASKQKYY